MTFGEMNVGEMFVGEITLSVKRFIVDDVIVGGFNNENYYTVC
jgi:hypothetical protein